MSPQQICLPQVKSSEKTNLLLLLLNCVQLLVNVNYKIGNPT